MSSSIGSIEWIKKESSIINNLIYSEAKDLTYATRQEINWLNEYMIDITNDKENDFNPIINPPSKQRVAQLLNQTATSGIQITQSQVQSHSPNKENLSPTRQYFTKEFPKDSPKQFNILSPKFENGSQQRGPFSPRIHMNFNKDKSEESKRSESILRKSMVLPKEIEIAVRDPMNIDIGIDIDNNNEIQLNQSLPSKIESNTIPLQTKVQSPKESSKPSIFESLPTHTHTNTPLISSTPLHGSISKPTPVPSATVSTIPIPITITSTNTTTPPINIDVEEDKEEEEEEEEDDDDEFLDAKENETDTSFLAISQSIRKNNLPQQTAFDRYSILANKSQPLNPASLNKEQSEQAIKNLELPDEDVDSDISSDSSPISRHTFGFASLPTRGPLTKKSLSKNLSNSPDYSRHNSIIPQDNELELRSSFNKTINTARKEEEMTTSNTNTPTEAVITISHDVPKIKESTIVDHQLNPPVITTNTADTLKEFLTTTAKSDFSKTESNYPDISDTQLKQPAFNEQAKNISPIAPSKPTSKPLLHSEPIDTPTKQSSKEIKASDNSIMSRTAGGVLRFAKQLFFDDKKNSEADKIEEPHQSSQPTPNPIKLDTLSRLMAPTYASNRKNISPTKSQFENIPPSPSPSVGKTILHTNPAPKPTISVPPSPEKRPIKRPRALPAAATQSVKAPTSIQVNPTTHSSTTSIGSVTSTNSNNSTSTTSTAKHIKPKTTLPATHKPTNVKLTKQPLQPKSVHQPKPAAQVLPQSVPQPTPQPTSQPTSQLPPHEKVMLKIPLNKKDISSTTDSKPKTIPTSNGPFISSHKNAIGPSTSLKANVKSSTTTSTATNEEPNTNSRITTSTASSKSKLTTKNLRTSTSTSSLKSVPSASTQPRLLKRNPQVEAKSTKKRSSDQAFGTPLSKSSMIQPSGLKSSKLSTHQSLRTPSTTSTISKMTTPQIKKPSYTPSNSMMKSTLVQQAKAAAVSHSIPQVEGVNFSNDKIKFAPSTMTPANHKTPNPYRQVPTISNNSNTYNLPRGLVFTPQQPEPRQVETILPEILSESEDDDDGNILQDWANSPQLRYMLLRQQQIDPDQVFGPIAPLHLDEVFRNSRVSKFRPRSSSANWSGQDKLTQQEVEKYAKEMGYQK